MNVVMAPQYDMIRTKASVAYQFTQADTDKLVYLLTGRNATGLDGVPGHSVVFRLKGVPYEATYRIAAEWWDRKAGVAWGIRMAGLVDVVVSRIGGQ
jgi:hypothetical protein